MMSISFSIIIPVYNSLSNLRHAIKSIRLAGKKYKIEIIVIDDCSSDESFVAIKRMRGIICAQTQHNCGPGGARNLGIALAKNNYIVFCDADDKYHKDFFKICEEFISAQTKIYDFIGFNAILAPNTKLRTDKQFILGSKSDYMRALLHGYADNSVIFNLWRRDFIIENNLVFRHGFHEDVDYMLIALDKSQNYTYIDKSIYIKFNQENSIINTMSSRHIHGYLDALLHIANYLKTNKLWDEYVENYN